MRTSIVIAISTLLLSGCAAPLVNEPTMDAATTMHTTTEDAPPTHWRNETFTLTPLGTAKAADQDLAPGGDILADSIPNCVLFGSGANRIFTIDATATWADGAELELFTWIRDLHGDDPGEAASTSGTGDAHLTHSWNRTLHGGVVAILPADDGVGTATEVTLHLSIAYRAGAPPMQPFRCVH